MLAEIINFLSIGCDGKKKITFDISKVFDLFEN